jgi:hypothetical protein
MVLDLCTVHGSQRNRVRFRRRSHPSTLPRIFSRSTNVMLSSYESFKSSSEIFPRSCSKNDSYSGILEDIYMAICLVQQFQYQIVIENRISFLAKYVAMFHMHLKKGYIQIMNVIALAVLQGKQVSMGNCQGATSGRTLVHSSFSSGRVDV